MKNDIREIRSRVINLATHLALEKIENYNKTYYRSNGEALDEACKILKIDTNEFLKMFI
ncbi:hypothetical protein [Clostridium tetani]|uniref:hypothetical protein n=1 Tax=Clostridium tetani TaxID=1513 RepID=UPI0013E964C8|nr:hypothetical protein [Clostridium tetani]